MAGERRCGRCRTVLTPPQPWATTDEPQVAAALPLGDEHRSDEACTGCRPRRTPYPSGGTARRECANSPMKAASTKSDRMPNGSSQTSGARRGSPTVRLVT